MSEIHDKKIKVLSQKLEVDNMSSTFNRARSVTVGTCFGGICEIMLRGSSGTVLWCPLQQFEVVELIDQLAASVGCTVVVTPKNDFSSWRNWRTVPAKETQDEQAMAIEKTL